MLVALCKRVITIALYKFLRSMSNDSGTILFQMLGGNIEVMRLGSFWVLFKRFWMKILNWLRLLNVAKYASTLLKSKEKTGIPGVSEKSFSCIQVPASAP